MDRQVLHTKLTEAIQEIQEVSGEGLPEDFADGDHNYRLGEISNFDSMRAAEVVTRLSDEITCEIKDLIPLFDPTSYDGTDHFEEIKINRIVDHLDQLASNS
jgi:acyl carrier protein